MEEIKQDNPIINLSDDTIRMSERLLSKVRMVEDAPASKGRTLLLKYLGGGKLTARQSVIAFCCECMGFYHDGRHDCENYMCSHYPLMPYGKLRKKRYVRPERRKDSDNGS